MGDFSLVGGYSEQVESGITIATIDGVTVTASASTNTPGAWTDIVTAVNNTASTDSITVVISSQSGAELVFLVSIAIGAAASEEIIIENMQAHMSNTNMGSFTYTFPMKIASGVRISARCQSQTSSGACGVSIIRGRTSFSSSAGLAKVTTYGADTSDSAGTTIARNNGSFGSWVEMTSSTTDTLRGFVVSSIRENGSWSGASKVTYEVGVGSAGNEETVYSGIILTMSTIEAITSSISPFVPVSIAAGQRIAIRAAGNLTNADLDHDYVLHGVN